jgi:hypothetical protein
MIYSADKWPTTLASKTVPNGRCLEHHVSVREQDGEFFYCNGWSDPLNTDRETAFRFFNENTGRA